MPSNNLLRVPPMSRHTDLWKTQLHHMQMHISKLFISLSLNIYLCKSFLKTNPQNPSPHKYNTKHTLTQTLNTSFARVSLFISPLLKKHARLSCEYCQPFHPIHWYRIKEKYKKKELKLISNIMANTSAIIMVASCRFIPLPAIIS